MSMILCLLSCTNDDVDTTNDIPQEDTQPPSQAPIEDSLEQENSNDASNQQPVEDSSKQEKPNDTVDQQQDHPAMEDGGIYDDGCEWKPVK